MTAYIETWIDDESKIRINTYPSTCPWCKSKIGLEDTEAGISFFKSDTHADYGADLTFQCKNQHCLRLFLAHYKHVGLHAYYKSLSSGNIRFYTLQGTYPIIPDTTCFDKAIQDVSNRFVATFNEAEAAEAFGLSNVAGPGYRKAFEILIKDFLISLKPSDEAAIINEKKLAKLISDRIDHGMLKDSAARAAWLGNDEKSLGR